MSERYPLHLSYCDIEATGQNDATCLSINFGMGTKLFRKISVRSNGVSLKPCGDALLCFGLRPAIELGVDLHIHSTVSTELLQRCDEIQRLLCKWYPGSKPVRIFVDGHRQSEAAVKQGRKVGAFYSGGVDSSFTVFQTASELNSIITIVGADVAASQSGQAHHLEKLSAEIAEDFGLQSVLITTDMRKTTDRLIGWVEYHGSFLAGVGHLLSQNLDQVLIASSADQSSWNRPWGSHPGLDPLWSTADMKIEHHGLVDRLAKIDAISNNASLMSGLRVCDYDDNNCGECEDCNFMFQALDVLDARSKAPTFRNMMPNKIVLPVTGEGSYSDLMHLRDAAIEKNATPLANQIQQSLRIFNMKKALFKVCDLNEMVDRFKRYKRRRRYRKACETGEFHERT